MTLRLDSRLAHLVGVAVLVTLALLTPYWFGLLPMLGIVSRLWGMKNEVTTQSYDDLTVGAIDDADTFWPVTGGNAEKNLTRITREEEVRGRRAATAPRPFRAEPTMNVPVAAYRTALEKALRKTLGAADQRTGTPPAAITHRFDALGFGSTALPTVSTQLIRDDVNHKMSGASFNRFSATFPLDGEGSFEVELWGLYLAHFATAAPTAVYTGFSEDVMMLRDAQVFIDGSGTAIQDLQGFEFSFTNNLNRKFYAKRNVVTQVLGTPSQTRKLWWPEENKLGAAQDVTYALQFGNPNPAQELAHDFSQVQKFVFEVTGGPLATTPAASELLRITIFGGVHTGGGPEPLTAREDMTARYEGGAFYSETDAADIRVEVVNNTNTDIV